MPYKNIEDRRAKDRRQYWRNPEKYRARAEKYRRQQKPLLSVRFSKQSNRRAKSCSLIFAHCAECQALMIRRRNTQLYCSFGCQRRRRMRDYQRKTRYAATGYWKVASTPEAQRLALEYFNLRMELRPNAKYKDQWRSFYASRSAADSDHSEHALGTGSESSGGKDNPSQR